MGTKVRGGESREPVAGLEREEGLGRRKRGDRWQQSPVPGGPVRPCEESEGQTHR